MGGGGGGRGWLVRKGEKMKESKGKRKEAGTTERFPPKKNFINGEDTFTVLV